MKVKGFGARPSRNVSSGGQKSSFDEYNRSFKGDPYNLAYKKKNYGDSTGYMERGVEEYHRVPEMKDMTSEDDQKENAASAGAAVAAHKSRQLVLRQVAGLLLGSVVLVAGYQASLRERSQPPIDPGVAAVGVAPTENPDDDKTNPTQDPDQQPTEGSTSPTEDSTQPTEGSTQPTESPSQPATTASSQGGSSSSSQGGSSSSSQGGSSSSSQSGSSSSSQGGSSSSSQSGSSSSSQGGSSSSGSGTSTETSTSWNWSADGTAATLVVRNSSGNVVSEVTADVTTSTTAATCNKAGRIAYTASASANGQTYSDTQYKTLPALGHSFDSGKEVTLADGRTAMDYECTRCHEHFTVVNSIDEE